MSFIPRPSWPNRGPSSTFSTIAPFWPSGKNGNGESYTVHGVAPETGVITAIRLEALTHPSLPMDGPGRSGGGNFVLSQFIFETDGVPHKFRKAIADYSQDDYPVNEVVKNDLAKGWGISGATGRDHQALFYLDKPHPVREGQAFVFTLRHSPKHAGYSLGRFRIAVTFASERFLALPLEAQKIVLTDPAKRTAKEMEARPAGAAEGAAAVGTGGAIAEGDQGHRQSDRIDAGVARDESSAHHEDSTCAAISSSWAIKSNPAFSRSSIRST